VGKAKKKQLPKDFEALLVNGSLEQLKALFDRYDVNARGGVFKQTALAFHQCPDALARWLVERGADLAAGDSYGDTPLHSRARHWQGRIEILLELGADVTHGENNRGTPLHAAAGSCNATAADLLLRHGARVDVLNRERQTPLGYALQRCSNAQIERMAALAKVLIAAGARQTPEMKTFVARIGTDFEFHRSAFNPDSVEATSAALYSMHRLCLVDLCMTEHHPLWRAVRTPKTNIKSFGICSSPPAAPPTPFKVKLFALQGGSAMSLNVTAGSTGTWRTKKWRRRSCYMLPLE
jgi:hypothetical protein